jgi:hypothetical protein
VTTSYGTPPPAATSRAPASIRWREDVKVAVGVIVTMVLLGAPAGLLWSALAPHYVVHFSAAGPDFSDIESTKAFIGADASYLLVMLGFGLVCGGVAWLFARRSGPWTVVALALGGVLAALIAASVGLRPGAHDSIQALQAQNRTSGTVELYLGKRDKHNGLSLRAPWAALGWPAAAVSVFLIGALRRPEDVD